MLILSEWEMSQWVSVFSYPFYCLVRKNVVNNAYKIVVMNVVSRMFFLMLVMAAVLMEAYHPFRLTAHYRDIDTHNLFHTAVRVI